METGFNLLDYGNLECLLERIEKEGHVIVLEGRFFRPDVMEVIRWVWKSSVQDGCVGLWRFPWLLQPDQVSPLQRSVIPLNGDDLGFVLLLPGAFFEVICRTCHKRAYDRSSCRVVRGSGESDRRGGVSRIFNPDQAMTLCKYFLTIRDLYGVIKNDKAHGLGFEDKNLSYVPDKSKSCLESRKLLEGKGEPFRKFELNPSQGRL